MLYNLTVILLGFITISGNIPEADAGAKYIVGGKNTIVKSWSHILTHVDKFSYETGIIQSK